MNAQFNILLQQSCTARCMTLLEDWLQAEQRLIEGLQALYTDEKLNLCTYIHIKQITSLINIPHDIQLILLVVYGYTLVEAYLYP